MSVRVARKDLRVGRHRQVLARRARTAPTTSLAETLSTSIAVSQVELHVASAALFQPEAADRVQHVVSARVLRAQGPAQIAFLVVDARGQSVDARQAAIAGIGDSGAVFTTALLLPGGRHELRVGAARCRGRHGHGVPHARRVSDQVGPFDAARLTVLELDAGTGRFAPCSVQLSLARSLAARLDLEIDVEPEDVSFALQRAGDSESALILAAITSVGQHRWAATGSFPAPTEAGRYLVTATARGLTFEAWFEVR